MGQRRGLDHQFNGHKSSQQVRTSNCLYGTLCYCPIRPQPYNVGSASLQWLASSTGPGA